MAPRRPARRPASRTNKRISIGAPTIGAVIFLVLNLRLIIDAIAAVAIAVRWYALGAVAILTVTVSLRTALRDRHQSAQYTSARSAAAEGQILHASPWERVSRSAFETMTPSEFEHALANLCRRDGCTNVRVVGGKGDLGADVICTTPDGRRLVIQAKRYAATNKVGSGDVQKVGGTAVQIHGANIAAVVTTSTYTKDALDYTRRLGIRTYDGTALGHWASRTGPAPWH